LAASNRVFARVMHRSGPTATGIDIGITIGLSYKVDVDLGGLLLQSRRGCSYKVDVDNFTRSQAYAQGTASSARAASCSRG
jgi:hypothetical protein